MVQEIVQKLAQDANPARIITIVGAPGMGKTTVAIHVSHLLQEKHKKPVIFIEQNQKLSDVCSEILRGINPLAPRPSESHDMVSMAKRRLKELDEEKVIVLDDVERIQLQGKEFDDFLVYVGRYALRVQLIITTREDMDFPSLSVHQVLLDRLDPDSSAKLLQDSVPDQNELHIKELGELCGIPLVLILLACLIKHSHSPEMLVRRLRQNPIQLLINAKKAYADLCTFLLDFPETVTADLVRLSVFPFAFSVEDMKVLFGDLSEPEDVKAKMVGYSLLRRINDTKVVLHPLVREFLRAERKLLNMDDIGKEAQKNFNQHYVTLLESLSKQFITKQQSKEAISTFRAEKANILEMFKNFLQGEVDQEDTGFCIDVANSTVVLDFLAKVLSPPSECVKLYDSCYHIAEASNDLRRLADCLTSLGFLCLYKEAHQRVSHDTLEKFQRAYEIRQNLPKELQHCETHAHTISKLGLCYALQVKIRIELSALF